MRNLCRKHKKSVFFILVLLLSVTIACTADGQGVRSNEYDFFAVIQMLGDDRDTFARGTASVRQDDTIVGGLGIGWHMNRHLSLTTDVMFGVVDLMGSTQTVRTDFGLWNINLDWYPWKSSITPVLTGGVGLLTYQSDTAPVSQNAFNDVDFSYNAGGGVRWDFNKHWFAKAVYRLIWTKWDSADNGVEIESIALMLGFKTH